MNIPIDDDGGMHGRNGWRRQPNEESESESNGVLEQ